MVQNSSHNCDRRVFLIWRIRLLRENWKNWLDKEISLWYIQLRDLTAKHAKTKTGLREWDESSVINRSKKKASWESGASKVYCTMHDFLLKNQRLPLIFRDDYRSDGHKSPHISHLPNCTFVRWLPSYARATSHVLRRVQWLANQPGLTGQCRMDPPVAFFWFSDVIGLTRDVSERADANCNDSGIILMGLVRR